MSNVRTLRGPTADLTVEAYKMRHVTGPVARILLPVQGTDREFAAQEYAIQIAANLGVPVYAVHVASPLSSDERHIFRHVNKKAREWGVTIQTRCIEAGDVIDELIAESTATDLIVIGTRHLGTGYHIGSVAEQLIRRANCPVQVVRLPD